MSLRLAMLGMWHVHADGIVRQVAAHPNEFHLVGFHDADPAVVEMRREAWGQLIPQYRVFSSAEELLAQPLDGVVVEGRVSENLPLARLALQSGRPVLLEKPAGCDRHEHRKLVELANGLGLHVQMIYLFRYMPAIRELLDRARQGEFGQIYMFRGRLPKELSTYERWVDELQPYRGGIFFEMGGHLIDLMVTLLGPPSQTKSVMAHHHTSPPESFVDNGVALFQCEQGCGVVEVPALETAPGSRRIEVYGTAGSCVIPHLGSGHLANDPIQVLQVHTTGQPDWQRIELPNEPLQIHDLREFSAVVRGKKTPQWSMQHDLDVQLALLDACGM
ncbi:MAG: Gfo/Idh/MocA family protein [Pirellulales bacterium]